MKELQLSFLNKEKKGVTSLRILVSHIQRVPKFYWFLDMLLFETSGAKMKSKIGDF